MMKCPVCVNVELVMSERQGIEIDYCPSCRGIWLDRGELDKIIEKGLSSERNSPPNHPPQPDFRGDYRHHDPRDYHKRRKHWLNELFD